jgi:hypothetical protein
MAVVAMFVLSNYGKEQRFHFHPINDALPISLKTGLYKKLAPAELARAEIPHRFDAYQLSIRELGLVLPNPRRNITGKGTCTAMKTQLAPSTLTRQWKQRYLSHCLPAPKESCLMTTPLPALLP